MAQIKEKKIFLIETTTVIGDAVAKFKKRPLYFHLKSFSRLILAFFVKKLGGFFGVKKLGGILKPRRHYVIMITTKLAPKIFGSF